MDSQEGTKSQRPGAPDESFAEVVEAFLGNLDVTPPSGRGFGSSGLRVRGKIFAFLSSKGEFIVKLPRLRVDALIATGAGFPYDPGHGRVMKEWVVIAPTAAAEWLPLAREALVFVAAGR
jgi:hypothetical protein